MPEPSHLANLNLFNVREQQFLNLSVTWLSQQHSKFDIAQGKTLIFWYSLLPGWFSYYLLNTLTFTTPTATSPSQAPSPSYPHPWTRPLFKKFLNFFKWGSDSLLRSSFTKSNEGSSVEIQDWRTLGQRIYIQLLRRFSFHSARCCCCSSFMPFTDCVTGSVHHMTRWP